MPKNFGSPFWRITFGGRLFTAEQWSTNLSVIGVGDAIPTVADAETAGNAFVTHIRPKLMPNAVLDTVKIARIGADGLYGPNSAALSVVGGGAGLSGSGTGTVMPPQVALAVTLLGANPRDAAGNGRIYLPAPAATLGPDGRYSGTIAKSFAESVSGLIGALNGALEGGIGIVGPETATGRAPGRQYVASVRCGRILDTIRSRRSSFPEEYEVATLAVANIPAG